ncbi:hypothetical protein ACJW31_11G122800 [Castanea mollissima]
MGPDLELKGKSKAAMEVSVSKENAIVLQGPEDKLLKCATNCQETHDNTFSMETLLVKRITEQDGSENMEVNITDCTNSTDAGLVESECQDVTEQSSSFGDTESGTENGLMMTDGEVESRLYAGDASASVYDGYFDTHCFKRSPKKKKLTVHWRKFIRPLMWRCKWIELQIKELQSQALKYDRKLAKNDERKPFEFECSKLEAIDAKSLPYSSQIFRSKVMKRKKRKRLESTIDIASYMSQHNLFSYIENKRPVGDSTSMVDNCGNLDKVTIGNNEFEINYGWSSLEFGNGDNSFEEILRKIEVAHSQVRKLKAQIDKVIGENPGKFSSINQLSLVVPDDALTSSDQNPASPFENGHSLLSRSLFTASQHMSECDMGDTPVPEFAFLSDEELIPLPNIIDSMDQPQVGVLCANNEQGILTEQGILIHNQAAKEELDDFGTVRLQLIEKPQVPMEEQKIAPKVEVSEANDLPSETAMPNVQSNVKSRSTSKSIFPRKTRRRGRRKAGKNRWSKRPSG